MKRWIIDLADTIDIYITARFNLRPKQRMLEYMMDHYTDPYIESKIQEALDNDNTYQETPSRFSRHAK